MRKMADACIIGYGALGKRTAKVFNIKKYYDRAGSNITLKDAAKCRFIFISLPTPTIKEDCFTDDIEAIVKQLSQISRTPILVIRSTVKPGFTKHLCSKYFVEAVHNPSFSDEGRGGLDMEKEPDLIVIGGENKQVVAAVADLWKGRSKTGELTPMFLTDSVTSETIKYVFNAFYALKVVYFNEIYDICQRNGASYKTIREAIKENSRIGNTHSLIFHKGGRGAGGKCLKKDLELFAYYTGSKLLKRAVTINQGLIDATNKK